MKIVDYKVVKSNALEELERVVNELINDSYTPHGSLVKEGFYFYQPMVRME